MPNCKSETLDQIVSAIESTCEPHVRRTPQQQDTPFQDRLLELLERMVAALIIQWLAASGTSSFLSKIISLTCRSLSEGDVAAAPDSYREGKYWTLVTEGGNNQKYINTQIWFFTSWAQFYATQPPAPPMAPATLWFICGMLKECTMTTRLNHSCWQTSSRMLRFSLCSLQPIGRQCCIMTLDALKSEIAQRILTRMYTFYSDRMFNCQWISSWRVNAGSI